MKPGKILGKKIILFFLLSSLFCNCNKVDTTTFISYKPYYPLKPGKYLIYKLDSTIAVAFGTAFVTHSYIIKDSVTDIIYDNSNRPSLRIERYIKDAGNQWQSNNTFVATLTDEGLEYVENNGRYIKMTNPVSTYTIWKGNAYIGLSPFDFDNDFGQWEYSYNDIKTTKTFNGINYPNTITIVQFDSTKNKPFDKYGYTRNTKSYEVYGDSVGMLYKDLLDLEYQVLTQLYNCKHVYKVGQGYETVAINCNNADCDSLNNLPGHSIIGCDTVIQSSFYNGYGVRQVLLEHN